MDKAARNESWEGVTIDDSFVEDNSHSHRNSLTLLNHLFRIAPARPVSSLTEYMALIVSRNFRPLDSVSNRFLALPVISAPEEQETSVDSCIEIQVLPKVSSKL
ncbi:hypothetical protein A0J61_10105 [Choanephora cucurbitarum]|uniref:Uncharacterized protein n=1 Tax=Choanephora cucurbitarum TaxID=101091 RepID=A0A1C7MYD5_9FUNG|nr:hypothetical protein A0J61_10105 [Choanephora cucurbitarum]